MISQKTLFILGAGSHFPYGMPLGSALKNTICDLATSLKTTRKPSFLSVLVNDPEMNTLSASLDITLKTFAQELLAADTHQSVDSFIASRANHPDIKIYSLIAKVAIAFELRRLEFQFPDPIRNDDHWMRYIFRQMAQDTKPGDPEDFIEKNNVKFVTFNYDRNLEYYLYEAFNTHYHLQPADALKYSPQIEIAHVYGSFGKFEPSGKRISAIPWPHYATEIWQSARNIRLMYDERAETVDKAKDLIGWADIFVFLGFAFDGDNIAALELRQRTLGKTLWASRFGIEDGDWQRIKARFGSNKFNYFEAKKGWRSLRFLESSRWHNVI